MAARHSTLSALFTDVADAIRDKLGTTATYTADDFDTLIGQIETDPSGDTTAAASDLLSGKTAYSKKTLITGTIPTKTSSDLTASGATVTVPSGYYASSATKSVATGSAATPATTKAQSTPTFSRSGNVLTANVAATSVSVTPNVTAGYVSSGTAGTITMSASSRSYTIGAQSKIAVANGEILPEGENFLSKTTVALPTYDGSVEGDLLPLGGRVFYVNTSGGSGATYTFYDANKNVITDQTVSGLANAKFYKKTGTTTVDKFYVYDTTNGLSTNNGNKYEWGYYGVDTGATSNTIGSGKTNTAMIFARGVQEWGDNNPSLPTIWKYISDMRTNKVGGCDDWFVASNAEQEQLRSSGLVDWYINKNIWSSVEDSFDRAYGWYYSYSYWNYFIKFSTFCVFGCRAF